MQTGCDTAQALRQALSSREQSRCLHTVPKDEYNANTNGVRRASTGTAAQATHQIFMEQVGAYAGREYQSSEELRNFKIGFAIGLSDYRHQPMAMGLGNVVW